MDPNHLRRATGKWVGSSSVMLYNSEMLVLVENRVYAYADDSYADDSYADDSYADEYIK